MQTEQIFVDDERQQIESALESSVRFGEGCPSRLMDAIRYSLLGGGKRLRPALVLRTAAMCGADVQQALPAACAVEMVHTYSLIHDDLPAMDDDHLRRGKPTCHVAFDQATAILAGDALLARAFEILASRYAASVAAMACAELAAAAGASQLVGGQCDDLFAPKPRDAQQLAWINQRKTAALISCALKLGGIVAGETSARLAKLGDCGLSVGLAFQIVDDLLDRLGDQSAMGKPTGSDLRQGKQTFPDIIGIDACQHQVEKLYQQACSALAEFGEAARPLLTLIERMVHRDR